MNPNRRDRGETALSQLFIETARTRRAFERIDELVEHGWEAESCRALLMLGPSRVGKTRIISWFVKMRSQPTPDGQPGLNIICVEVPPGCSLKSFAAEVLTKLGDPDPEYGSENDRTRRIIELAQEQRIDLIIIDEVQRLIDADTDRVKRTVASWLTALLNKRVCPLLLVGEESAERVFDGIMHIKGRTFGQIALDAYDWARPEDRDEFRAVLFKIEQQLGLPERSNLALIDTALRIHAYAKGRFGEAVTLISQARIIAQRNRRPCITHEMLAQAVDELRIGQERLEANPFLTEKVPGPAPARAVEDITPRVPKRGRPRRNAGGAA